MKPSEPFANGRDTSGRFTNGNQAAAGRSAPHARRVARLRAEFLRCVSPVDVREVLAALIKEAKSGNVMAMREFFSRTLGPAEALDALARLEALEGLLERVDGGHRR